MAWWIWLWGGLIVDVTKHIWTNDWDFVVVHFFVLIQNIYQTVIAMHNDKVYGADTLCHKIVFAFLKVKTSNIPGPQSF